MTSRQAEWLKTPKGKAYSKDYKSGKLRKWKGCDICKQDTATEKFNGVLGHILWVCGGCYKTILSSNQD